MRHEAAATILFGMTALFGLIAAFAGFVLAIFGNFQAGVTLGGIALVSWIVSWLTLRWMQ